MRPKQGFCLFERASEHWFHLFFNRHHPQPRLSDRDASCILSLSLSLSLCDLCHILRTINDDDYDDDRDDDGDCDGDDDHDHDDEVNCRA